MKTPPEPELNVPKWDQFFGETPPEGTPKFRRTAKDAEHPEGKTFSNSTYVSGCRCDDCKLAHRVYQMEYRARRPDVVGNKNRRRHHRERAAWAYIREHYPEVARRINAEALWITT